MNTIIYWDSMLGKNPLHCTNLFYTTLIKTKVKRSHIVLDVIQLQTRSFLCPCVRVLEAWGWELSPPFSCVWGRGDARTRMPRNSIRVEEVRQLCGASYLFPPLLGLQELDSACSAGTFMCRAIWPTLHLIFEAAAAALLWLAWLAWLAWCDAPATTLRWCWGSTSPHACTALYPRVTSQPKAYLLNHDTQHWLRCSSASATAPPNSSFVPFPTNTGNTHSGKRDTTSQQHRPGGILLR